MKTPVLLYSRDDWMDEANCLGAEPKLFFPSEADDGCAALKLCRACKVAEQCLEYAFLNKIKFGIWGGLRESARDRARRKWLAQKRAIAH